VRRQLSVGHNSLKELPASLGNCTALVDLNVEHNRLKTLPSSFSKLTALDDFNMHNNQLKEIPPVVLEMPALRWLSLGKNQIATLPTALFAMPKLEILHCQSNFIQEVTLKRCTPRADAGDVEDPSSPRVRWLNHEQGADPDKSAGGKASNAVSTESKLKVLWLSDNPMFTEESAPRSRSASAASDVFDAYSAPAEEVFKNEVVLLQRGLPRLTDLRVRSTGSKGFLANQPIRSVSIDHIIVNGGPSPPTVPAVAPAVAPRRRERRPTREVVDDVTTAFKSVTKSAMRRARRPTREVHESNSHSGNPSRDKRHSCEEPSSAPSSQRSDGSSRRRERRPTREVFESAVHSVRRVSFEIGEAARSTSTTKRKASMDNSAGVPRGRADTA